jgi:glycosyltransferase involved in cell wall biosynthesis
MRIGLIQKADAGQVGHLSGTPYFMARSLQQHVGEIVHLGPDHTWPTLILDFAVRATGRASLAVLRRRIATDHNPLLSRRYASVFSERLKSAQCDVLFAPFASVEIASLQTSIPIVYQTDMNWSDIVNYYPGFSSLARFAQRQGDTIEAAAIQKARALVYPAEWAKNTAMQHYGASPSRVFRVAYGANIVDSEVPPRELALQHTLDKPLRLLWLGVDWQRKGGPEALECLSELRARGIDASLTVCGCTPPPGYSHPSMTVIPFLSKKDPVDRQQLRELFLNASFFLFPTTADASPISLSEASAHGLPSIARDTGGVSGAVFHGQNGYLLPRDADGRAYASTILQIIGDPAAYHRLVASSRDTWEKHLNWDAWGRAMKPIFESVVQRNRE